MSRELRRLLIEPPRLAAAEELLMLEPAEQHYLERVLRYRSGDRLAVLDGVGHLWTAVLVEDGRLQLEQGTSTPLQSESAATPALELAMAVPKREADVVWRMATELGADRLQPLVARRSVRTGSPPRERWAAVLREAVEQCERLWLPALREPVEATGWLAAGPRDLGLLATTRRGGLVSVAEALSARGRGADPGGVAPTQLSLAIGPEGGWTEEEERVAEAAGWIPVSMGKSILRTATASVAGLAVLSAWREISCREISSSSFPGPSP